MRFGVNYIPSSGWLYSWLDWSAASVEADLSAIAGLGLDHVRVHCLWPLFQPNADLVSASTLRRLRELVEIAEDVGLDVYVCVLNGWMSGTDFRPFWQTSQMNMFTDRTVRVAQCSLIGAVISTLSGCAAFRGVDIANEPNVLATAAENAITRAEGDQWVCDLLTHCESLAPDGFHVVGVDHAPWLSDDSPFSRDVLGAVGSASAVHSWIFFTGALRRYGRDGVGTLHLARYLIELARAFGSEPDRPVWLQEIGVSEEWIPGADAPGFAGELIDNAASASPWGITWWCSHDIDRSLSGFESLEYGLGLFDSGNRVKPVGRAVAEAVRRQRDAGARRPEQTELVLPDGTVPDLAFADSFFARIRAGESPRIVRGR